MDKPTEFTAEEHYRRGLTLLEGGHGDDAFEHLSRAYLTDPQSARYRSAYALALVGAAELARAAVRQEFYNPDLYLNLARIYLTFDMKSDAIRFLRRGLMVEPDNDQIQNRLVELGVRRRPLFRFLPRSHVFNRIFGRVQSRVLGPSFRGLTRAA
jgi:tetratricopeptide (TPR) repeat protein